MREQKLYSTTKKSRIIIAIMLLITSVLISVGFSLSTQRGARYWVARQALIPGASIDGSAIELRRLSLGTSSQLYFEESEPPIETSSKRFFAPGEIISRSGVSESASGDLAVFVPLFIRSVDIPDTAQAGDLVTLYWVLDGRGEQLFEPEQIARDIYIHTINRRGSNFGSDLAVTVSVSQSQVQKLLSYTSGGRIVVVPSNA